MKFVEDGGWDFLDLEKSDDEDEESEESEGTFACAFALSGALTVLTGMPSQATCRRTGRGAERKKRCARATVFRLPLWQRLTASRRTAGVVGGRKRR